MQTEKKAVCLFSSLSVFSFFHSCQRVPCLLLLCRRVVTVCSLFPGVVTRPRSDNFHWSMYIYSVSQEECARLREGVPYIKVYRYKPNHLCPKLNGYGDNGQRKVWSSGGPTHCTCQLTLLSMSVYVCGVILRQFSSRYH